MKGTELYTSGYKLVSGPGIPASSISQTQCCLYTKVWYLCIGQHAGLDSAGPDILQHRVHLLRDELCWRRVDSLQPATAALLQIVVTAGEDLLLNSQEKPGMQPLHP